MGHSTKIATCCYCSKRAALVLRGRTRQELACSGCGAPLHEMKMLKTPTPERPSPKPSPVMSRKSYKPMKKRKKKSRGPSYFVAELFDELEDLIEDIFD